MYVSMYMYIYIYVYIYMIFNTEVMYIYGIHQRTILRSSYIQKVDLSGSGNPRPLKRYMKLGNKKQN